jgi:hypothetical protein
VTVSVRRARLRAQMPDPVKVTGFGSIRPKVEQPAEYAAIGSSKVRMHCCWLGRVRLRPLRCDQRQSRSAAGC